MFQIFKDIYENIKLDDTKLSYDERLQQVIEDVSQGKLSWSEIPSAYMMDRVKICRGLLKININFYDSFEDVDRINHDVIKGGIMVDRSFYGRLPEIFKENRELLCFQWSCYPDFFSELPDSFRNKTAIVIDYVSSTSDAPKYFEGISKDPSELDKWAKIFVEAFVADTKNGFTTTRNVYFASRYLLDKEWLLNLVSKEPFMVSYAPVSFFNDPFFVYKLFQLPNADVIIFEVAFKQMGDDLKEAIKGKNLFSALKSMASREILKEKHQEVLKNIDASKLEGAL